MLKDSGTKASFYAVFGGCQKYRDEHRKSRRKCKFDRHLINSRKNLYISVASSPAYQNRDRKIYPKNKPKRL